MHANIVGLSYRCYYIVHTGFVRLDYQRLTIHSTSVEIHVLPHSSASCRTIPLTVETYDLNQLSGDAFNVSQVLSCVQHASGSSNTFLVPWENTANGEGFIFKVAANVCATDETGYYQLQPNSKPWVLHACSNQDIYNPVVPLRYTQGNMIAHVHTYTSNDGTC